MAPLYTVESPCMLTGPLRVQVRQQICLIDILLDVLSGKFSIHVTCLADGKSFDECPESSSEENGGGSCSDLVIFVEEMTV
jgi:hypothetical protein